MNLSETKKLFEDLTRSQINIKRKIELLRPHDAKSTSDWFMCLPEFFNDALDIRYTEKKNNKKSYWVWTQGADFSFSAGDTLYDTKNAYEKWSDALPQIRLCIQIISGQPAGFSENGDRFPGRVKAKLLVPNSKKSQLVVKDMIDMTQYEFVQLLIFGPESEISKIFNDIRLS